MQTTVLIADDHVDTVETTHCYLLLYGYNVTVAYDGLQALTKAAEKRPDSILLDIALPKLDGFEVARVLRQSQTFSDTVIIGYSGYGGEEYYEKARTAGIDYYLLKPCDPEVLIACLEPEEHPAIIARSVIVTLSENLKRASANLLAQGQALSLRSAAAVKRAQEICHKNPKRNSRRFR